MSVLRLVLPGAAEFGDLDDTRADVLQALADLYAYPAPLPSTGWVRANMVSTLDGAAAAEDGLSKALGGKADKAAFSVLRALADVVLVGASTAREEGYRLPKANPAFADRRATARQAPAPRLAVVSRSGDLTGIDAVERPDPEAPTLIVTCATADLPMLRARYGPERVLVAGDEDVDPAIAVAHLAARGMRRILLEGGPRVLGSFVAAAKVDELCLTLAPTMLAGDAPRIATGAAGRLDLRLAHLVEAGGTLLTRWVVQR